MEKEIFQLAHGQWLESVGYNDLEKDKDGFVVLRPTASRVDKRTATLTTDINELESKLKSMRAERSELREYKKTDQYQESKKNEKKKKNKKQREALLTMVFNNAPTTVESDEDEEDGYREGKRKRGRPRKQETTLETQYGKRYAPIVSMLYDSVADFDRIAAEIDAELNSQKGQVRNMYRSTQIGNLLSAKEKKLSAIKEIGRVADKLSDMEYKREKDAKVEAAGQDTTKAIANLGSKYLRGVFNIDDAGSSNKKGSKSGKKGAKGKKEKGHVESNFAREAKSMGYEISYDVDDDSEVVKKKKSKADSDTDLAEALAKELMGRGGISFSAAEKHLDLEGTYEIKVQCSSLDPDGTWKYVPVDKKGKKISDFPKDLLPRKKDANMRFEMTKNRCYDAATGKRYQLMLTE